MKPDPYLTTCIKLNSKCIKYLNLRPKTIKLLEENIVVNLHNLGFGTKSNNNNKTVKLDFIKIKNSCASKDITKKMKRQPRELEKNICKSHIC